MTMPLQCPCPGFGLKPKRLVESSADAVAVVVVGPAGASARRRATGVSRLRRRRRADHGAGRRADRRARQRSAGAAARHRRTDQRAGAAARRPTDEGVLLLRRLTSRDRDDGGVTPCAAAGTVRRCRPRSGLWVINEVDILTLLFGRDRSG
jgi:hypothetical protein